MSINTTEFLARVKRAISVPSIQYRFTDDDFLKMADEEMESRLLPEITSVRQSYYVKHALIPVVEDVANYKIPYRAIGRTIVDLKLKSTDETYLRDLPIVTINDKQAFTPMVGGDPRAFLIEGENIVLLPTPTSSSSGYYLEVYYELKPSRLVTVEECSAITAIDTVTGIVTIDAANANFASGDVMDLIDGKTSNSNKAEDITASNVSGTAVTFTAADLPSDLAVGDYVTSSDESCFVQAPQEFVQCLVQSVICRILHAQGDFEGLTAGYAELDRRIASAKSLMAQRVKEEVPVVINRRGLLTQRPYYIRHRLVP